MDLRLTGRLWTFRSGPLDGKTLPVFSHKDGKSFFVKPPEQDYVLLNTYYKDTIMGILANISAGNIPEHIKVLQEVEEQIEKSRLPADAIFPALVWEKIALKMTPREISKLCQVSRYFQQLICSSQAFWHQKLKEDFPEQKVYDKNAPMEEYKRIIRHRKENIYREEDIICDLSALLKHLNRNVSLLTEDLPLVPIKFQLCTSQKNLRKWFDKWFIKMTEEIVERNKTTPGLTFQFPNKIFYTAEVIYQQIFYNIGKEEYERIMEMEIGSEQYYLEIVCQDRVLKTIMPDSYAKTLTVGEMYTATIDYYIELLDPLFYPDDYINEMLKKIILIERVGNHIRIYEDGFLSKIEDRRLSTDMFEQHAMDPVVAEDIAVNLLPQVNAGNPLDIVYPRGPPVLPLLPISLSEEVLIWLLNFDSFPPQSRGDGILDCFAFTYNLKVPLIIPGFTINFDERIIIEAVRSLYEYKRDIQGVLLSDDFVRFYNRQIRFYRRFAKLPLSTEIASAKINWDSFFPE